MTRWRHILLAFGCAGLLAAAGLDDELTLEGDAKTYTEAEVVEQIGKALAETDRTRRGAELLAILEIVLQQPELVLPPRDDARFVNGLLDSARPDELRPALAALLRVDESVRFSPPAQRRLNLGIRLALVAEGANYAQLQGILDDFRSVADLEWLLPAIGRAGGKSALPQLQSFRQDASIIPLGNHQNIRRLPCAAVLACAYAGDDDAFDMILSWYEQDFLDRPRFAFYVQWAEQEGQEPDYALLDYCQHRVAQAERLFLGRLPSLLPRLISSAIGDHSAAITDFVSRRLAATGDEGLTAFLPLFEHPSILTKRELFMRCYESGSLRDQALATVRGQLQSQRGLDRWFAFDTLCVYDREGSLAALRTALADETSAPVRRRMQRLMLR